MTLIDWLWCFPQTLAGFIWSKIKKAERTEVVIDGKTYTVYMTDWQGAVSLGKYIIVNRNVNNDTIKHEYGHQLQSYMLGWLYLVTVGACSYLWCNYYNKHREEMAVPYHSYWCEKWADELGGVER